MAAPKINKDLCIGCGACAGLCPEVFEMGDDNKAQVKAEADFENNADCINNAKDSCPASAIS